MLGFKETLKELKKVIKSKISIVEMLINLAKFKKMVGNEEADTCQNFDLYVADVKIT